MYPGITVFRTFGRGRAVRGAELGGRADMGRCRARRGAWDLGWAGCWGIDAGRGLGARGAGADGPVPGLGRMGGDSTRGRDAGGRRGEGAGLPEFGHVFEAGEEAGEAGADYFDYGINDPMSLDRPQGDGCAERRELCAQGGWGWVHAFLYN